MTETGIKMPQMSSVKDQKEDLLSKKKVVLPKIPAAEKARLLEEKKRLKKKEAQIKKIRDYERMLENMSEQDKNELRQKQIRREEREKKQKSKKEFGGDFIQRYESTALQAVKRMFRQLNQINVKQIQLKEGCVKYEPAVEEAVSEDSDKEDRDDDEDPQYYENIQEL